MSEADVALRPKYPGLLANLKTTMAAAGWRAQRVVNTELRQLYWRLGHAILSRLQLKGWGTCTRVIERLGTDLPAAASPRARPLHGPLTPGARDAGS